jgi:hypothetical protein
LGGNPEIHSLLKGRASSEFCPVQLFQHERSCSLLFVAQLPQPLQSLDHNPLWSHSEVTPEPEVFNTLGQQMALLQNGEQEAGYHEVKFDAVGLSSGV